MKILLTSYDFEKKDNINKTSFDKMVPLYWQETTNSFTLDYALFIFADEIIMDKKSYNQLKNTKTNFYKNSASLLHILFNEGLVKLEDYDKVLNSKKKFLKLMNKKDLTEYNSWVEPFKKSIETWKEFTNRFNKKYDKISNYREYNAALSSLMLEEIDKNYEFAQFISSLYSATNRRKAIYKAIFKNKLENRISYVNSNLILSNHFNATISDWNDYIPFYEEKFIRFGKDNYPLEKEKQALNKLFNISFPNLSLFDNKKIIKILTDKRLVYLREMIEASLNEGIEFDKEFAIKTLEKVIGVHNKINKLRTLASYCTMPIGYIPLVGTPLQKLIEEGIVLPTKLKLEKELKWYFFINEIGNE